MGTSSAARAGHLEPLRVGEHLHVRGQDRLVINFLEDVPKSSRNLILIQSNFTGLVREGSRQQRTEQNVIIK